MQNIRFIQSPGRFVLCAIVLPIFVAASNQLLIAYGDFLFLRVWLFPWMALSTAALGWMVGRYLSPAWLRWLVFGWSLALLNLLTIAACLGGNVCISATLPSTAPSTHFSLRNNLPRWQESGQPGKGRPGGRAASPQPRCSECYRTFVLVFSRATLSCFTPHRK